MLLGPILVKLGVVEKIALVETSAPGPVWSIIPTAAAKPALRSVSQLSNISINMSASAFDTIVDIAQTYFWRNAGPERIEAPLADKS